MPALELAKRRDLEMIVANADLCAVLPSGSLGHMPGAKPVHVQTHTPKHIQRITLHKRMQ
jgi:hypothetical protein